MKKPRVIKLRDLRKKLFEFNCQPRRISGSHEIWVTSSGKELPPVIVGHPNDDVYTASHGFRTLKKILLNEGFII